MCCVCALFCGLLLLLYWQGIWYANAKKLSMPKGVFLSLFLGGSGTHSSYSPIHFTLPCYIGSFVVVVVLVVRLRDIYELSYLPFL